jgi:hypothetical protein
LIQGEKNNGKILFVTDSYSYVIFTDTTVTGGVSVRGLCREGAPYFGALGNMCHIKMPPFLS